MTNKYLEKISGIYSGVVKPIFGAATDVVKAVGKDALKSTHLALGGGLRDAAAAKGITNQHILRGAGNAPGYSKATKALRTKILPLAERPPNYVNPSIARKSEIRGLQSEQKKSIVKTVGYVGAAGYTGNKILDKIKGNSEPQYYQ